MTSQRENLQQEHRIASFDFLTVNGLMPQRILPNSKVPAKTPNRVGVPSPERVKRLIGELREDEKSNIGVAFYGDVLDLDIDGENANNFFIPMMVELMPLSLHVWGRERKMHSHWPYRVEMAGKKPFDQRDFSFIQAIRTINPLKVEFKGGPQTRLDHCVLPGSVHPSGDLYLWRSVKEAKKPLVRVHFAELLKSLAMAAVGALIAPYWNEGIRQDLAMAIAGFFHQVNKINTAIRTSRPKGTSDGVLIFTYKDAQELVRVLTKVVGDRGDNADLFARLKAVQITWEKGDKDQPITGASRIAELTGDKNIKDWLYALTTEGTDTKDIEEFRRRYVIWRGSGCFIDLDEARRNPSGAVKNKHAASLEMSHLVVRAGEKEIPIHTMARKIADVRLVDGFTLVPDGDDLIAGGDTLKVNAWNKFSSTPWPEPVTDADVEPFRYYLWEVVAALDEKSYRWVVAWLADIFQEPANKSGTSLVLVGAPGAGKTFLGEQVLAKLLGADHYHSAGSMGQITGKFNEELIGKLLVQCDEAVTSSTAQGKLLRAMVTSTTLRIEPKGQKAYTVPNFARFFFTSNDLEGVLHLDTGKHERRFTVLEVSPKKKDDLVYWAKLIKWLDVDNLSKIHRWLLDWRVDAELIQRPLSSRVKEFMQNDAMNTFHRFIYEVLDRRHPLTTSSYLDWYDAVESVPTTGLDEVVDLSLWPAYLRTDALKRAYDDFCDREIRGFRRDGHKKHSATLWGNLEQLLGTASLENRLAVKRVMCEGRYLRVRKWPSYKDLKRALSEHFTLHLQDDDLEGDELTQSTGVEA